jgi:tetratricopeptide (TPR) repeat protein
MGGTLAYGGGCASFADGAQQEPSKRGQAGQQSGKSGTGPTAAENQAYQAIQNELDPDRKLQMIDDFEKKYPKSAGLPFVFLLAASTYQQKGDINRVIEYGEKSLKLNGDNTGALLLMAATLPEPQALQGQSALNKEKKLSEAEDYANRAIKLIDQLPRQANETDEIYQKRKGMAASWAHSSLGMVHLERATMGLTGMDVDELAKAEKEYQAAVSSTDSPNPGDYFRLGEAFKGHGKTDEAVEAFSKASEFDQGGRIKALADKAIEELKKKKAEQKPPAKP